MKALLALLPFFAISGCQDPFPESRNREAYKTVKQFRKAELWAGEVPVRNSTRLEFAKSVSDSVQGMMPALNERINSVKHLNVEFPTPNEKSFEALEGIVGQFTEEFKAMSISPENTRVLAKEAKETAAKFRYMYAANSHVKPFFNTNETRWARDSAAEMKKHNLNSPIATELFDWFATGQLPTETRRTEWAVFVDSSVRNLDKAVAKKADQKEKVAIPASLFPAMRKLCKEFAYELQEVGATNGELEEKLARAERRAITGGLIVK